MAEIFKGNCHACASRLLLTRETFIAILLRARSVFSARMILAKIADNRLYSKRRRKEGRTVYQRTKTNARLYTVENFIFQESLDPGILARPAG